MGQQIDVEQAMDKFYRKAVDDLAALQKGWEEVDDELVSRLRRDIWSVCVRLHNHSPWYRARFSKNGDERCHALHRLSGVVGEEDVAAINEIALDSTTPRGVVNAAKRAVQRIQLRHSGDLVERIDQILAARLQETFHGPVLDNYQGHVCARVTDAQGAALAILKKEKLQAQGGQSYQLEVWLQPDSLQDAFAEPVFIEDGRDSQQVTFEVSLDSETVKFTPRNQNIIVVGNTPSSVKRFSLTVPRKPPIHEIWVELYQKSEIIQTLRLVIQVDGNGAS